LASEPSAYVCVRIRPRDLGVVSRGTEYYHDIEAGVLWNDFSNPMVLVQDIRSLSASCVRKNSSRLEAELIGCPVRVSCSERIGTWMFRAARILEPAQLAHVARIDADAQPRDIGEQACRRFIGPMGASGVVRGIARYETVGKLESLPSSEVRGHGGSALSLGRGIRLLDRVHGRTLILGMRRIWERGQYCFFGCRSLDCFGLASARCRCSRVKILGLNLALDRRFCSIFCLAAALGTVLRL